MYGPGFPLCPGLSGAPGFSSLVWLTPVGVPGKGPGSGSALPGSHCTGRAHSKQGGGTVQQARPPPPTWPPLPGREETRGFLRHWDREGRPLFAMAARLRPLLALLALGTALCPQETLAQPLPTTDTWKSEGQVVDSYEASAQLCWADYKEHMDLLEKDWCNWTVISRPYSALRDCLEVEAEVFSLGFPNPLAERVIFETHQLHFSNCSLEQPTLCDPPEDVLLAMIIAPICLIPFFVTLVVWRSKGTELKT
ncbi:receptor activity-modifying protein 2 isoform X1 [Cavia porcellus]|uniref:receptor activity-modifying protein 2 isoform X1 n=1 Tax=Cavia porcellus TaxID=10141 RepID=UPI002FE06C0F